MNPIFKAFFGHLDLAKIVGIGDIVIPHNQRGYFQIDVQLRDEPITVQRNIVERLVPSWPARPYETTMVDFQKGHYELIDAWTAYRVWENENLLKK